ncbi:hypothetical protein EDB80DRAFT_834481 [Ilyonectria destructans]|nr:hypothetical protein EDB80DRAFT_834481 [Ilyonectria destructans]
MTFGYESGLAFSKLGGGIDTFALDLLNRLRAVREDPKCKVRPLVFIAHSLGGIVVKKALILAHHDQDNYGGIIYSTKGVVLLGTPHRGSDLITWALLLANLTNGVSWGEVIRTALLKDLDKDSHVLSEISHQFVHRATPLKIRSFIEQRAEPPLNTLIVPKNCAVLRLPNEVLIPVNPSHRTMCRFASATDQEFGLMEGVIKDILSSEETSITPSSSTNTVPGCKLGSHCSIVPRATEKSVSLPSNDVEQSQRALPRMQFRGVESLNISSPENTSRSSPFDRVSELQLHSQESTVHMVPNLSGGWLFIIETEDGARLDLPLRDTVDKLKATSSIMRAHLPQTRCYFLAHGRYPT